MLAEAGESVSLSPVKGVLYIRGLKGHFPRENHESKRNIKKATLQFADAQRDKDLIFGD